MDLGIITEGQLNLIKEIRKFWEQQVMWMRFYIQSAVREDPDLQAVLNRLFINSRDFYYLLLVFFGRPAAERFASFITVHMSRIVSLIDALKANDQETVNRLTVELNENANECSVSCSDEPLLENAMETAVTEFVGQTITNGFHNGRRI